MRRRFQTSPSRRQAAQNGLNILFINRNFRQRSNPLIDIWLAGLGAAMDRAGVALGHTPLAEKDLAAERLVTPFDCQLPNEYANYVVYPERGLRSPALEISRSWRLSTRQDSVA